MHLHDTIRRLFRQVSSLTQEETDARYSRPMCTCGGRILGYGYAYCEKCERTYWVGTTVQVASYNVEWVKSLYRQR